MKIYVGKEYVKYEGSRVITVRENIEDVKRDIDNEAKESYGFMGETYIQVWEFGTVIDSIEHDTSAIQSQAFKDHMKWSEEQEREEEVKNKIK